METEQNAASAKPRERRMMLPLGPIIIVVVVLAGVGGMFALTVVKAFLLANKYQRVDNEFAVVDTAARSYEIEYNHYPVAGDNATLTGMLTGKTNEGNSRGVAFMIAGKLDEKGEWVDPWDTPYQFSVTADGKLHACSAGPDKKFGTADDISGDTNLIKPQ